MVKCSLCGADGVSKATCPLNTNSKNPNPSKHNVNKSSNKDSLHNLIDNISKSCPSESTNLNMLKTLIPDKPIKQSVQQPVKQSVKKPDKQSVQQSVKKPDKKPDKKLKKSVKKSVKKKLPTINLKSIFTSGYVFKSKGYSKNLNHTVIKQLLSDDAESIVLLVKNNVNEKEYVIKVELTSSPIPQVYNEESVFNAINNNRFVKQVSTLLNDKSYIVGGIPKIEGRLIMYDHSPEVKTRLFIEEKLDISLSQYIKDKQFSVSEIKKIGSEYIKILQYIHANGYLHLDIKPPNLMMKNENGKIKYYIIDFGISKKWYSEKYVKGGDNTYYILNKPHSGEGTPLYKSIHAERVNLKMKGTYFNRSEDLEALGYVLLEMFIGELPWKHLENESIPHNRLDAKLNAIEYVKKISDDNLRNAISLMVTSYDKPYDYEPEYKYLLDLLK